VKQALNGAAGGDGAAVGSETTTAAGRPRIADLDGRKSSSAHGRETLNGAAGGAAAVGSATATAAPRSARRRRPRQRRYW